VGDFLAAIEWGGRRSFVERSGRGCVFPRRAREGYVDEADARKALRLADVKTLADLVLESGDDVRLSVLERRDRRLVVIWSDFRSRSPLRTLVEAADGHGSSNHRRRREGTVQ